MSKIDHQVVHVYSSVWQPPSLFSSVCFDGCLIHIFARYFWTSKKRIEIYIINKC